MGYSCTAAASMVASAIGELIADRYGYDKISNYVPIGELGGFWERGKEQEDGAITGSVFKTTHALTPEERKAHAVKMGIPDHPEWVGDLAKRAGSVRIEADGTVTRFPGVGRDLIAKATELAGKRFLETFGTLERTCFAEPAYA